MKKTWKTRIQETSGPARTSTFHIRIISWYPIKLYQGIRLQNFMNVSASFLCSEATFYCGAWDLCWDCTESFALTVGRTQNTIPSKVLQRWAPVFVVFVSNFGKWWWMVALSRPFTSRRLTMKLHDRGIPKLNETKIGSVRTGPQNWISTLTS